MFSVYCLELLLLGARRFGQFDNRTKLEVVADLRKQGIDAVPAVFPSALWENRTRSGVKSAIEINGREVIPLGGISKKLTVMCNESGKWITYRSDEHGFNNPEGIWSSRDLSIAAVGDSFVFGACVPADANFVSLVRKKYSSTLNLGINGAGPLVEFAAVKEFLPGFRPRVTLWFYLELNDQLDLLQERQSELLNRYLQGHFNQGLMARQSEIDQALSHYVDLKRKMAETDAFRERLKDGVELIKLSTLRKKLGLIHGISQVEASSESDEIQIRLFREILRKTHALIKTWNGTLYFVYLPAWERYKGGAGSDNREAILALVKGLRIPIIDIHEAFQTHGDPLRLFPFRQRGHYNEEGHRIVAEAVLHRVISGSSH